MSVVDWRANRLVDALAKRAAASRQAPMAIIRLLSSGRSAVRHAAALLGRVTHAANNCTLNYTLPDGTVVQRICRDAQQPRFTRKRPRENSDSVSSLPALPAPLPQATMDAPSCAQLTHRSRGVVAREEAASRKAEQEWHVRRRVAEIAATCRPSSTRPSGEERLEQLRRRVRARLSEAKV